MANQDTEDVLRVLGTPHRDQRPDGHDLVASVWAKLSSPNQPRTQPPDLGLPLGGRGGSQGASKDVDVGNMREIRHCGHFAALPNVPLPVNQLLSSRPLSRLRWNAPPHPTWGGLRMNTNALLQFKLATPRLRVCAPVSGASKGQGSRVGVTGAGRQQQKKKGEGRKAGMEEKKWKGEGKRERGADLVLTFPFSPLRQKKKKQAVGAGAAGHSRPRCVGQKSLCRISKFLETTRRRHAALD